MNERPFPKALMIVLLIAAAIGLTLTYASSLSGADNRPGASSTAAASEAVDGPTAVATFAGGCFWCMEGPFDQLDGVLSTTSGYIGGHVENPSYQAVTTGRTGHTEAVEVVYNPEKVDYETLLQVFWLNIDPTDQNKQFCDRGSQYRSGIFFHDADQQALANASLEAIRSQHDFEVIHTEITRADTFYPAEEYHQDYYLKNPVRYKYYRTSCGRDRVLNRLWGDAQTAFTLK